MKLLLLEDFAANTYSLCVAALHTLCSHMQLYGIHQLQHISCGSL